MRATDAPRTGPSSSLQDIPLRTRYIALYRSVKTVGVPAPSIASRDGRRPTPHDLSALRLTARTVGLK